MAHTPMMLRVIAFLIQICLLGLTLRLFWVCGFRRGGFSPFLVFSALLVALLLLVVPMLTSVYSLLCPLANTAFLLILLMLMEKTIQRVGKTQETLEREKRHLSMLVDSRVADLETEVAERKRAEEALREDASRFTAIISVQHDIATAELDLQTVMDLIAERTMTLTKATGAIIHLVDGKEIVFRSASGRAAPFIGTRGHYRHSLTRECICTGQILRCDDAERDSRVDLDICRRLGARSLITVPLTHNRQIIGALQVFSAEPYAFGAMDMHTLELMAGQIGAAMSHQAEFEAKQTMLTEALERANRDPLTGLFNHRVFHKRLEEESDNALRHSRPLAIAMIDLDNFKFFNDTYGHMVGDGVLQTVADALRDGCRDYDTVARFGGDEFALLMPGLTEKEALLRTARISRALSENGYHIPDTNVVIPISLSIGVAIFPEDETSRIEALEIADTRLRHYKTGGRGVGSLTEAVRIRLQPELSNFTMLNALVTAVDNKDRYTRRHSEDVMTYSLEIGKQLGLDAETLHVLEVAALLHDVGKIGVPDAILRKPGMLTESEFEAIKHHAVMGAVIVSAVPGFTETLPAIQHHHERWDGGGYPDGLVGISIPLIARLMAVADAFSAMTTDRPYRKGMQEAQALEILQAGAGTQWDPDCVAAFLQARQAMTSQHDNFAVQIEAMAQAV